LARAVVASRYPTFGRALDVEVTVDGSETLDRVGLLASGDVSEVLRSIGFDVARGFRLAAYALGLEIPRIWVQTGLQPSLAIDTRGG
jgi:hypothetical protein